MLNSNIITENNYWKGVRHIFSPNIVSKYQLCKYINEIYNLNISISTDNIIKKNITLCSMYDNIYNKTIPDINTQIIEQFEYHFE